MIGEVPADRRIVFRGLGALGAAAALAGCGSGGSSVSAPDMESGTVLGTTDEVPVGGGVIVADAQVVLVQPSEGEFVALSAVCTHEACLVSNIEDDEIGCTCHGSRFDLFTGEVTGGPAPTALPEVAITVEGDEIRTA